MGLIFSTSLVLDCTNQHFFVLPSFLSKKWSSCGHASVCLAFSHLATSSASSRSALHLSCLSCSCLAASSSLSLSASTCWAAMRVVLSSSVSPVGSSSVSSPVGGLPPLPGGDGGFHRHRLLLGFRPVVGGVARLGWHAVSAT